MSDHGFARLEHTGEEFRLICRCGWRSNISDRGAVVGDELDRHLDAVARVDA